MTAATFTTIFIICFAVMLAFQTWLSARQLAHVRAHRASVPAEFTDVITLTAHQKAADYTTEKVRLGIVENLLESALLLVFTIGGAIFFIDQLAHQFTSGFMAGVIGSANDGVLNGGFSYGRGLLLIFGVMAVSSIISMPFDLYRTFGIEAKYGFNKITLKLYILDALKGMLLSAVIGIPLLLVAFWLMEKMGSLWWLYLWLVWVGFSVTMMAAYPNFIAPLFNKFTPLDNESLRTRIETLLARCGFASKGLFVMDGSKRSSHGNAYFTGFGKSKRIVFFDTLIERLTPPEIEAVLAHELGHFKRKHIYKMIGGQFVLVFLILALMGWVIDKPWFYEGLGFPVGSSAPHVAVSLMLFFMVLPVFTFWLTPLGSLLSRKHEFEADAYAVEQTNADDLITALVKLYRDNASTLTPDPIHSAVYDSHPPAAIRIAHLNSLQKSLKPI